MGMKKQIEALAKKQVHLYAEEPLHVFHKVFVERLISFGLQILALPDLARLLELREQTRDECKKCKGMGEGFRPFEVKYPLIKCKACNGSGKGEPHLDRLVILAKDQRLPDVDMNIHTRREYTPDMAYEKGRQDMLDDNFQRIER